MLHQEWRPNVEAGLADDETLFVQERSVFASDLNSPIPGVLSTHGPATVGAVSASRAGLNAKLHRLAQAIVAIPAMFNRGAVRGVHTRIEKEQSWCDRAAYLVAPPISGRQTATELRLGDRDADGC
jgi:hypothetical protein